MASTGHVVGGHYLNGTIEPAPIGGTLILRSGLKWKKLNEEQVAEWEEVLSDPKSGAVSAVGQAVAGAVLPRFVSKAASAAVGATIDSKVRPPHTVRIDWADGKQSLIKLPEKLFTHFELMLKSRRVIATEPASSDVEPRVEASSGTTITEQALGHLSSIVRDQLASYSSRAGETSDTSLEAKPDAAEQLMKLASLRDLGILTEEEFALKKTEILSRL